MGMSSVKLGFSVAWPAFWTGVPFKVTFGLLFLAMGMHPWEGAGLAFLLLLSIPIDIWALGLAGRTVFLERLRLEPPAGLGLSLWWQGALLSVIYLPLLYLIHSNAVAGAKAVTHIIMGLLEALPVAEKISVELMLWGSVATVVLILLILGWLFLFGRIVRRQAATGAPSRESYQSLVRQWDLLRIPADQSLQMTIFVGVVLFLVVGFWGFLPVTTPHPHEDYEMPAKAVKPLKPDEALKKVEQVIAQAEATLEQLGKNSGTPGKAKEKGKAAGKSSGKAGAAPAAPSQDEHDGGAAGDHQH